MTRVLAATDSIRVAMVTVAEARRWARVLGPEHPRTWPLLALAARTETAALNAEVCLDELLQRRLDPEQATW